MRAFSSRPFCSYDSRRVSLRYLSAAAGYTTASMDKADIPFLSVSQLSELIKHRQVSPVEVVIILHHLAPQQRLGLARDELKGMLAAGIGRQERL